MFPGLGAQRKVWDLILSAGNGFRKSSYVKLLLQLTRGKMTYIRFGLLETAVEGASHSAVYYKQYLPLGLHTINSRSSAALIRTVSVLDFNFLSVTSYLLLQGVHVRPSKHNFPILDASHLCFDVQIHCHGLDLRCVYFLFFGDPSGCVCS